MLILQILNYEQSHTFCCFAKDMTFTPSTPPRRIYNFLCTVASFHLSSWVWSHHWLAIINNTSSNILQIFFRGISAWNLTWPVHSLIWKMIARFRRKLVITVRQALRFRRKTSIRKRDVIFLSWLTTIRRRNIRSRLIFFVNSYSWRFT